MDKIIVVLVDMIGIDGTRNGWITAEFKDGTWKVDFYKNLDDIEVEKALIDIPVGLPKDSIRKCDKLARDFLAPERHYSVFNCPTRKAVYADGYREACDINEKKTGRRISKQAWNIVPKIIEADKASIELLEAHPEVFLKSINPDSINSSKKSEEGFKERLRALENFGETPELHEVSSKLGCAKDDILDAMVLSLNTEFGLDSMPGNPETDERGNKMRIMKPKPSASF